MGKADPAPAPDYAAAAKEQGINERETATFNAALNRPDEFNNQGARQWKLKEGADPNNLQPGDYQLTTSLSPTEQKLYDMDATNRLGLGDLSNQMLGAVSKGLGTEFDMSQISAKGKIPVGETYKSGPELIAGQLGTGPAVGGTDLQAGPRIAANTNLSGVARKFNSADYSSDREKIAKAVYDSMTRRNEGQFARDEAALRDRLVNQGLDETSAAFRSQMEDFTNRKNDAYQEAARLAEIAGSQEQTRQDTSQGQAFQQQLGANESNFGQQSTAAMNNFERAKAAAALNYESNKGAVESNFQRAQAAGAQNFGQTAQALDANYSRGMASNQQALDQAWKLYSAQEGDRASSLQEQAYLRSLPLNEINAVRSGSQVNAPQFQNYATGFAANSAPLYQAAKDNHSAAVEAANAKNAGINNAVGLIGKVGAAYMTGGTSLLAGG